MYGCRSPHTQKREGGGGKGERKVVVVKRMIKEKAFPPELRCSNDLGKMVELPGNTRGRAHCTALGETSESWFCRELLARVFPSLSFD